MTGDAAGSASARALAKHPTAGLRRPLPAGKQAAAAAGGLAGAPPPQPGMGGAPLTPVSDAAAPPAASGAGASGWLADSAAATAAGVHGDAGGGGTAAAPYGGRIDNDPGGGGDAYGQLPPAGMLDAPCASAPPRNRDPAGRYGCAPGRRTGVGGRGAPAGVPGRDAYTTGHGADGGGGSAGESAGSGDVGSALPLVAARDATPRRRWHPAPLPVCPSVSPRHATACVRGRGVVGRGPWQRTAPTAGRGGHTRFTDFSTLRLTSYRYPPLAWIPSSVVSV